MIDFMFVEARSSEVCESSKQLECVKRGSPLRSVILWQIIVDSVHKDKAWIFRIDKVQE